MRIVYGLLLVLGTALAQQQQPAGNEYTIVSYENENNYDGSYKYSYQTSNGISVQEEGLLKNPGQKDQEAQTARGSYSFTAPDGKVYTVTWYADETGFHAEGAHLPTSGTAPQAPALAPQTIAAASPEFYRG